MLFKIHHCVNRVSRLYTVDVGNNDFIFLCNFGGRIIEVFEVEMRKMEGRGGWGGGGHRKIRKAQCGNVSDYSLLPVG